MNVDFRDGVSTQVIRDANGGSPCRIQVRTGYTYYRKGGVKSVGFTFVVDADQSGLVDDQSGIVDADEGDRDPVSDIASQILKSLKPDLDAAAAAVKAASRRRAS